MRHDILADALSAIKNGEHVGKMEVTVPASKVVREVLKVAQAGKYIGDFEFTEDGKSGTFKVKLIGNVSNCGAIKPRYSVGIGDFEKWEKRYLPSKNVGQLVVSTSKGLMSHLDAKTKKFGGVLIAYMY